MGSYRAGAKPNTHLKGWYKYPYINREALVVVDRSLRMEFDLQSGIETTRELVGVSDYGLDKLLSNTNCNGSLFGSENNITITSSLI